MILLDVLNRTQCLKEYIDLLANNKIYLATRKNKDIYISHKDIWLTCAYKEGLWNLSLYDERAYSINIFKIKKNTQKEALLSFISFIESKLQDAKV